MIMKPIGRDELLALLRSSNISYKTVYHVFEQFIHPSIKDWNKALKYFMLSLGIGFTTIGIIFFFAFNWNSINPSAKLITAELFITLPVVMVFTKRFSEITSNLLISTSCMMVGVFFAIYGQIYQTGANAYEFFMAWSIFTAIWVFVTAFLPLWAIFLGINFLWLFFYFEQTPYQVTLDWRYLSYLALVLLGLIVPKYVFKSKMERWFETTSLLFTHAILCTGLSMQIFSENELNNFFFTIIAMALLVVVGFFSFKKRDLTLIGMLFLNLVILFHVIMVKLLSDLDTDLLLLASIASPLSIIVGLVQLNKLKKEWQNETIS